MKWRKIEGEKRKGKKEGIRYWENQKRGWRMGDTDGRWIHLTRCLRVLHDTAGS